MYKRLIIAGGLMLATAGCVYEHPHHHYEEEVVVYDPGAPPPPPPPVREEVIVERPYAGAVWVAGHWELDREHHRWAWRRGYWH